MYSKNFTFDTESRSNDYRNIVEETGLKTTNGPFNSSSKKKVYLVKSVLGFNRSGRCILAGIPNGNGNNVVGTALAVKAVELA